MWHPSPCPNEEQASASFALHESESCAALLPCGLLPEELEELESLQLEADVLKSAAAPGRAPHRVLCGRLQGARKAVCSREEAGPRAHSRGCSPQLPAHSQPPACPPLPSCAAAATLKSITIATSTSVDAPAPLTPQVGAGAILLGCWVARLRLSGSQQTVPASRHGCCTSNAVDCSRLAR